MAPKTRSGGQPDAERVHHSSPALQQTRFPHRRTTIRGYGRRPKNLRRKIASRDSSSVEEPEDEGEEEKATSPQQSTLTQFNWVDRAPVEDEDELDRPKKRKRRKTEGDAPNSSPPRSTFHTQTLTQRYPELSFSSRDDDPANLQIDDSEDEKLSLVFGDTEMGGADAYRADNSADKENESQSRATRTPSVVPQTPTNKRVRRDVIPSSQDSPLTPMLARYSPANKRSPLKHKSTNTLAPLPEISEVPKLPRSRGMVIEDSTITKSPTSSVVVPSPGKENRDPDKAHNQTVKAVRFVTPRPSQLMRPPQSQILGEISILEDETAGEATVERDSSPCPVMPRSTPKPAEREIADSDDEFDELGDSYPAAEEDEYGEVGQETQLLVEGLVTSSEKTCSKESSFRSWSDTSRAVDNSLPPFNAERAALVEVEAEQLTSSPRLPTPRPLSQATTQSQTQDHPREEPSEATPTQLRSQPTQAVESQRISLDRIHAMGPQTDRSDIFISIRPNHVDDIVKGTKDHEFRSYRIPNVVTRMWIYVTAPISTLKYMAVVSNYKQPGEINESGIGNAEFNAGKKQSSFAYELQEVYELNNPVPLAEMKEHGWVAGPPQKYNYVPPTVVGHLMANLRCSIFGGEEDDQAADSPLLDDLPSELGPIEQHHKSPTPSKYTISQEVEKQILSEATLQNTSDPDLLVPSSSSQERRRVYNATPAAPAPKLPTKFTPTPFSRLPNPNPSSTTRRSVRLSQATTASQVSSPPTSPSKILPRASRDPLPSSSLSLLPVENDDDSSIQLPYGDFSLDTSQLLTKSQMLPDSVLRDDDPIEDDDEVVYETD